MSRHHLTTDALAASAPLFEAAERQLLLELRGLNAHEIYEVAYARLLKANPYAAFGLPQPAASRTVLMLGTDQRDHFVPLLHDEAERLASNDPVFDIGCGDGQTTAMAFAGVRCRPLGNFLEPNQAYAAAYAQRLACGALPMRVGVGFVEGIDSLLDRTGEDDVRELRGRQALVLAIHSLYFATDPVRFVNFLLDCLREGGRAVIIFACETRGYTGSLTRRYLERYDPEAADAFAGGIAARHALFGIKGAIVSADIAGVALRAVLGRCDFRVRAATCQDSRFYGNDLRDMFTFSLLAGLADIGERPVADKIAFVRESLFASPDRFDLAIETDGMRAHMLSAAQPQYYFCLEKKNG